LSGLATRQDLTEYSYRRSRVTVRVNAK